MPLKDPIARKEYHRNYMRERLKTDPAFKKAHLLRVRKTDVGIRERTARAIEDFRASGCVVCGESEKACLCAHHKDPTAKEFNISDASRAKIGLNRVLSELRKCVCLCHNCHAKLHSGLIKIT